MSRAKDAAINTLLGKPLGNEALEGEKYGVLWGLPILASDAISSVAYAGQEILMVLLPAVGMIAYGKMTLLSAMIVLLLVVLTFSYRQTIENYPNGGGAYSVTKDNFGTKAGIVAGTALSIDYIMTVAVSVSSGVEQLATAFSAIAPYRTIIAVVLVLLLMLGNVRGLREASRVFGIPTYAFLAGMAALLIGGFIKIHNGYTPPPPNIQSQGEMLTLFLLLKAFSNGCTALTGVEAVSNSVPNFLRPRRKTAKKVLMLLALIIVLVFGGTSILANYFHVVPNERGMLVLMSEQVFGRGFMYYYITVTTFIILIMAANTAYAGFPTMLSVMAKDSFVPRWIGMRGRRLVYTKGIVLLSVIAVVLLIAFQAKVSSLIGLYAIGVFISFTLSQSGMFVKWVRERGKHWFPKAALNGFGALLTFLVVCIVAVAKFNDGAWIILVAVPVLVVAMLYIHRHYDAMRNQLKLDPDEYNVPVSSSNSVIVLLESVNKSSVRALSYARSLSGNVKAFSVAIDEKAEDELRSKYDQLGVDIPLTIMYSPYREIVNPLIEYIGTLEEARSGKDDLVTVIVPRFIVKKTWHRILHNNTFREIERELVRHKHIVVCVLPLALEDDRRALKEE